MNDFATDSYAAFVASQDALKARIAELEECVADHEAHNEAPSADAIAHLRAMLAIVESTGGYQTAERQHEIRAARQYLAGGK